jgi:hypothetical protein
LRLLGSFPSNRESTRSRRQEECRVTDQSVRATPPRGSTHDRLGCPATENDHIRNIAGGFSELGVAAIGPAPSPYERESARLWRRGRGAPPFRRDEARDDRRRCQSRCGVRKADDTVPANDDAHAALRKLEAELPPLDFSREERLLTLMLGVPQEIDVILHAELLLEYKLIKLLERTGVTDDVNSSFPLRCRLARDLGLISEARYRALYVLNRVRNQFAQALDYKMSDADVNAIARHIDVTERYEAIGSDPKPVDKMRSLLAFLWTHIDSDVEKHPYV